MPTIVEKFIRPAGGADYTSLTAWEAARQGNIVTRDTVEIATCQQGATADTSALVVSGWTTDPTHYIWIRGEVPLSLGKEDVTKYRLRSLAGVTSAALSVPHGGGAAHIILESIQLITRQDNCDGISCTGLFGATGWIYIRGCYISTTRFGTCEGAQGIYIPSTVKTSYISNNIVTNFYKLGAINPNRGIFIEASGAVAYIYNNTVAFCERGIVGYSGVKIKNCVVVSAVDDWGAGGDFTTPNAESDYNISSTVMPPGAHSKIGYPWFLADTTDPGNYQLDPVDDVARLFCPSLAADPDYPITIDFQGQTRPANWDCGADQAFFSVGPVPSVVAVIDYDPMVNAILAKDPVEIALVDSDPTTVDALAKTPSVTSVIKTSPTMDAAMKYGPSVIAVANKNPTANGLIAKDPTRVAPVDYDPTVDVKISKDPSVVAVIDNPGTTDARFWK